MAWANVSGTLDTNAGTGTGSPWSAGALSASVSSGTRLIATATYNSASGSPNISSITDSLSNTWVKEVDSGVVSPAGFPIHMTIWSTVSASGTPTISMTFSGGSGGFGIGISCAAYSGTSTSNDGSELDISKITSSVGSTTYDSGTTATTTGAANELKIGGGGDGGANHALSAGTLDGTYTARSNDSPNGNAQTIVEDRDSGALGSTARATATLSTANHYVFAVAVFKLPPAGPTYTRTVDGDQPAATGALTGTLIPPPAPQTWLIRPVYQPAPQVLVR